MVADEITLQKVSISRIKQEMRDVYYLSLIHISEPTRRS